MIQVFDSWAGELSPGCFKTFALPYLNYIADNLPSRLTSKGLEPVPMTVFAKGAWYALPDLFESNYNTIGLDWLHDPAETYKLAQAKGKVLQGNADPGVLYGTREAMTKVVEEMVAGFGGGRQGWIANLGHGTLPAGNPPCLYRVKLTMPRDHAIRQARRPEVLLRGDSSSSVVREEKGSGLGVTGNRNVGTRNSEIHPTRLAHGAQRQCRQREKMDAHLGRAGRYMYSTVDASNRHGAAACPVAGPLLVGGTWLRTPRRR